MKLLEEQRIRKGIAVVLMAAAVFCYAIGMGRREERRLLQETDVLQETDILQEMDVLQEAVYPMESGTVYERNICVHVCGEVKRPGVYEFPEGSRIGEAIQAAGGFSQAAAEDALNLAQLLTDGQQIRVPNREEAARENEFESMDVSAGRKLNLNTATKQQLMSLSGIGEVRAEAILSYREKNGLFRTIEDIMNVPGIKESAFLKIKEDITV